jgi:hypothetical protein
MTLLGAPEITLELKVDVPKVNLAARLCDLAKRGEILLSDDLAAAVAHRHSVEALGRRRLDGFAGELPVFRISSQQHSKRDASGPRFVGRKAEMAEIETALAATAREKAGRIIFCAARQESARRDCWKRRRMRRFVVASPACRPPS